MVDIHKTFTAGCKSHLSSTDRMMVRWMLILFAANTALLWVSHLPCNDTAARYAPMAEAFANGDWQYAFHPRFGWFFSTVSGMIAFITRLDGFRACQLTALLLHTLAAWPLYKLFKLVWHEAAAFRGAVMYLLCSHLLRYTLDGLRESGKTFGFVLALYGLMQIMRLTDGRKGYIYLALGSAVMIWSRGDGLFTAFIMFAAALIMEIKALRKFPRRWSMAVLILLLTLLPQMGYNFYILGYPVPESRMAVKLKKMNIPPLATPKAVMP